MSMTRQVAKYVLSQPDRCATRAELRAEREAAGDKSREHLERGMLLDEVDRLRVELVTRPSAIEQAAPAVMLAVCACVWGSVALVWLR